MGASEVTQVFILFHGQEDSNGNLDFMYVDSVWTSREAAEGELKIMLMLKAKEAMQDYKKHSYRPYRIQNSRGDFFEIQGHSVHQPRFLHATREEGISK